MLLDGAEGDEWVSRRDARVRLPLERVGRKTADGVPYLAPEAQLFYKAKATRAKDQSDFDAALPLLDTTQRAWLLNALNLYAPQHPWREPLITVSRR